MEKLKKNTNKKLTKNYKIENKTLFQNFLETPIFRPDVKKNPNLGRPTKPFQEKCRQGQFLESKAILDNSATKNFQAHCNAAKLLANELGYDDCVFILEKMMKAEDPIEIGAELRKAYKASKEEGRNEKLIK